MYAGTALKYNFKVIVLYMSNSILCHVELYYISQGKMYQPQNVHDAWIIITQYALFGNGTFRIRSTFAFATSSIFWC